MITGGYIYNADKIEEAELFLRIITAPAYARELLKILQESMHNFDEVYESVNDNRSHK